MKKNIKSILNDHEAHAVQTASLAAAAEVWTCSMHPQIKQNEPGDWI